MCILLNKDESEDDDKLLAGDLGGRFDAVLSIVELNFIES